MDICRHPYASQVSSIDHREREHAGARGGWPSSWRGRQGPSSNDDGQEDYDIGTLPSHVWIRLHDREQVQRKLRISLSEHCNMSCFFCHNEGQGPIQRRPQYALSVDEIQAVVRTALSEGVTKVKLTGGEPLLYRAGSDDVVALVERVAELRNGAREFDLSMTTNGSMLPEYAKPLAEAGLDRTTVSVTTLNEEVFRELISSNEHLLARSLAGLRAARTAGLSPLKINTVLYHSARRGLGNLRQIRDLLELATDCGVSELRCFTLLWHDAFSEFNDFYHFFSEEMRSALEALLEDCAVVAPRETVETLSNLAFRFAHRVYPKVEFGVELDSIRLGFEAMKYNRLPGEAGLQEGPYAMRLAADGSLRATLNGPASYDLIQGIRDGLKPAELRSLYRVALEDMP